MCEHLYLLRVMLHQHFTFPAHHLGGLRAFCYIVLIRKHAFYMDNTLLFGIMTFHMHCEVTTLWKNSFCVSSTVLIYQSLPITHFQQEQVRIQVL